jgi:hypothetical protein
MTDLCYTFFGRFGMDQRSKLRGTVMSSLTGRPEAENDQAAYQGLEKARSCL